MCPTDALLAAIWQPGGTDQWMPALLDPEERLIPASSTMTAGIAV